MSNMTNENKSNETNKSNLGGYENLLVYKQAVEIFDLNDDFCRKFLNPLTDRRTIEQMVQAARSGKQNIVEGSLEKSLKMNIKLTGVARASFGELLEDYRDFLRIRKLQIWVKDDPKVLKIRNAYKTNWSYKTYLSNKEFFANLMITLITTENYLLDKMLRSLEEKFIREGGYSENLTKKRIEFKNKRGNEY